MSKIIEILKTFKYSVNIKDDFLNTEKLNGFFATTYNVDVLFKYLHTISNGNNKSLMLSGAYGTGKSFMISIIAALMSGRTTANALTLLLKKIELCTNHFEEFKDTFIDRRYIIVFANDAFKDFNQTIHLGISEAIEEYKLNIVLNSSFQSIIERIDRWQAEHKTFYQSCKDALAKRDLKVEVFRKKIATFDKKAYEIFEEIYPEVMGGERFVPLGSLTNITDVMREFEHAVKKRSYDGVIYIFDEFGRYLEQNILDVDVKQIQDAAEYCNSDSSSTLLLITHKDVFQYSKRLGTEDLRNEWEKVSGRFAKTHLIYEPNNTLAIVKSILQKRDNVYDKFYKRQKEILSQQFELLENVGVINAVDVVKDFYPLNYVSAITLPKLSQKLAQNERTLFTFLCGDEQGCLRDIFKNSDASCSFVTPDFLYDYFENNFKFLNVDSKEYKAYISVRNILSEIKDELETKFLKCLALFHIINEFKELPPSQYFLRLSLGINHFQYDNIVATLLERGVIAYRKHLDLFVLAYDIDFNIDLDVRKIVETLNDNDIKYTSLVSKYVPAGIEYPVYYNYKYKITRYLRKFFIDSNELSLLDKLTTDDVQDGTIVCMTSFLNNSNRSLKTIAKAYPEKIFFVPSQSPVIKNELKQLYALELLEGQNELFYSSKVAQEELCQYRRELVEYIEEKIQKAFEFSPDLAVFIQGDKCATIKNWDGFQSQLCKYFEKKYPSFTSDYVINYELINKTKLTSQIKKCRKDILLKLGVGTIDSEYFEKTGAENSIARILLRNTGIWQNGQTDIAHSRFSIMYHDLLDTIVNDSITYKKLLDKFASNHSPYGFRQGLFSFLFGIIMELHHDRIYISNGTTEITISPDVLDLLEGAPESYTVSMVNVSNDAMAHLEELTRNSILRPYIDLAQSKNNVIVAIYSAFKSYYMHLPKIVTNSLGHEASNHIVMMAEGIALSNSKDFFYKRLPLIYKSEDFTFIVRMFSQDIETVDNKTISLREKLSSIILSTILQQQHDLKKGLSVWLSELPDIQRNRLNVSPFMFLPELVARHETTAEDLLQKISAVAKGGIDYYKWQSNDDIVDFFNKFKEEIDLIINGTRRIETLDSLDIVPLSTLGEVLKDKLKTDVLAFGRSLSSQEIHNAIVQLLQEIRMGR